MASWVVSTLQLFVLSRIENRFAVLTLYYRMDEKVRVELHTNREEFGAALA
jgi:hypothetical protein